MRCLPSLVSLAMMRWRVTTGTPIQFSATVDCESIRESQGVGVNTQIFDELVSFAIKWKFYSAAALELFGKMPSSYHLARFMLHVVEN